MQNPDLFTLSDSWKTTYPDAVIGVLAMRNVVNLDQHPELERRRLELEAELRSRFGGLSRKELRNLPSLQPYTAYYGRYDKTYHVQLQLESVVAKGRSLPRASALVQAMFLAELKNQLLTAGHDWERIVEPLTVDVAQGEERYVLLNGQERTTKRGDMMIRDQRGIISSILYGPDARTPIVPQTRHVLVTVYGPPGVSPEAMEQHLQDLRSNVMLIAPSAAVECEQVYRAG